MPVTVQASKHPLKADWVYADVDAGQSIYEIAGGAHVAAYINGREVPVELHRLTKLKDGVFLTLWPIPQDDDIVKAVLTVAVAVVAPMAAGAIATSFGLGATATLAVGAGIAVAGNMAINALIPPQRPEAPSTPESFNRLNALTGTSNRIASFQPIPRLYGRFRLFPPIPMTARPFTEIEGDKQYFRMMLCLGYGPLEIGGKKVGKGHDKITQDDALTGDPIRIGETDISLFEDVEFEIGRPDQMTLYSDQVIEVQPAFTTRNITFNDGGTGTRNDGEFAIRTTEPDTDEISIDISGSLFSTNDKAKTRNARVRFRIEFREVGESNFQVADDNFVISSSKKETIREGFRFKVARGQYEVKLTRVSTTHTVSTGFSNELTWSALRSIRTRKPFLVEDTVVMSLRIKATDQLSGRIEDLSVLCTSVLPVYDGTNWNLEAANNPAWAFADLWTGPANRRPLNLSDLEQDDLKEWADFCDSESLEFNHVYDSSGTTLERAGEIAGAGFATWQFKPNGTISVVRDIVQSIPKMIISPRNSFGFNFEIAAVDVPECLRVQFVDDRTFENTERLVFDDGFDESNTTKFETLQAKGVTNPEQAHKYGRFHLAQHRLRPERYNFSQDVQHLRYQRGDMLTLQHDVISVGIGAGRIKDVLSDTEIEIDEVFVDEGKNYSVKIQHQDGSITVVGATPGAGATNTFVTLDSAVIKSEKDDLVIFGEAGKESIDVKVNQIEPSGDLTARISCVPAAPDIDQSFRGDIPAFDPVFTERISPNLTPPRQPVIESIISNESVLYVDDDGSLKVRMVVDTRLVSFPGWDQKTQLRFRPVGDNSFETLEPTRFGRVSVTDVDEGIEYEVQVRGVKNEIFSPWSTPVTHTVTGKSNPPPDVAVFSATQNGINVDFDWDSVTAPDLDGYVIRVGGTSDTFDSAGKLLSTGLLSTEATTQLSAGTYKFFIKAEDTTENLSENAAEQIISVQPPAQVQNFTAEQDGIRVNFNWSAIRFFGLDGYEIRIGSGDDSWETSENLVDVGALSTSGFELVKPGRYRFFIKAFSSLQDESDQESIFDLTVEPPGQVQNFNAIQNGETVVFRWQQVDFFGLKGYEIRFGDAETVSWESGSKLVEANQSTAIAQADVPPGNYKFMIKAISDLDSESKEPAERTLKVKTDYFDRKRTVHHPDWIDGWYRGFEDEGDVLIVKSDFEAFYVTDEVDLLFDAEDVRVWAVLEAAFSDSESTVDKGLIASGIKQFEDHNGIDIAALETIDNGALQIGLPLSNPFVFQEIASRNTGDLWQDDGRLIERNGKITDSVTQTETRGNVAEQVSQFESYDTLMGWQEWTKGDIDARFVKYRARIKQKEGEEATKLLRRFTTVVDVEEKIESKQSKTVEIGGTTFVFDRTFHFLPAVVATVGSDDALFPIRKSLNTKQVTFVVKDLSGNDVGTDNLDFIVTGA